MQSKKWFDLELEPSTVETGEVIQLERTGGDCCGCCGCFDRCFRRNDGQGRWVSPEGRWRNPVGGQNNGAVGGALFVVAVVAMVVLVVLVLSLDGFGDVVGSSVVGELGSGGALVAFTSGEAIAVASGE